jgi:hypothetical protein
LAELNPAGGEKTSRFDDWLVAKEGVRISVLACEAVFAIYPTNF